MNMPRLTLASCTILFALVLHFFIEMSPPFIQTLYIVETSFNSSTKQELAFGSLRKLTQIRLGIWGACYYSQNNNTCPLSTPPYNVTITENKNRVTVVEPLWSGLILLQAFASLVTLIAYFLAQFCTGVWINAIAVFAAGVVSMLGLMVEIFLLLLVKGRMQTLGADATTNVGLGFWMTLFNTLFLGGVSTALLRPFFTCCTPSNENEENEENEVPTGKDPVEAPPSPTRIANFIKALASAKESDLASPPGTQKKLPSDGSGQAIMFKPL